MSAVESPWWRVTDAASYAKVHPSQIFRACRERKLEQVLGDSAQIAVDLDSAAYRAVRALKRLQPRSERKR